MTITVLQGLGETHRTSRRNNCDLDKEGVGLCRLAPLPPFEATALPRPDDLPSAKCLFIASLVLLPEHYCHFLSSFLPERLESWRIPSAQLGGEDDTWLNLSLPPKVLQKPGAQEGRKTDFKELLAF